MEAHIIPGIYVWQVCPKQLICEYVKQKSTSDQKSVTLILNVKNTCRNNIGHVIQHHLKKDHQRTSTRFDSVAVPSLECSKINNYMYLLFLLQKSLRKSTFVPNIWQERYQESQNCKCYQFQNTFNIIN